MHLLIENEGIFCEGVPYTLQCPEYQVIDIQSVKVKCCGDSCASSGQPGFNSSTIKDALACNKDDNVLAHTFMPASNIVSLRKARTACDNKTTCEINIWGTSGADIHQEDPCPGVSKRASVNNTCWSMKYFI